MGVYRKEYVIMGYDLMAALNNKEADQLYDFIDEMDTFADNKGLEFIYDGMDGEYCFLGKVLNEGGYGGMPIKKYHVSDLETLREEVLEKVKELKIIQYPALYSFTHWY